MMKEDKFLGSSSVYTDVEPLMDGNVPPQPMEGLHETGPPPFLSKTYDFVDDPNTNHIVSWSKGNNSFIVWDPQNFAKNLLPRKVDPDKWEFANEGFLRGQRHLLKNIKRRKTASNFQASNQGLESCVEVGSFGLDAEIDRLRRDKQVLMVELVKLRQLQQNTNSHLKEMEQRLKGTELKQRQTMSFLAKALKNPTFLQQMVQQKDRMKELEDAIGKKRRKRIDLGSGNLGIVRERERNAYMIDSQELGCHGGEGSSSAGIDDIYVKIEPEEFGNDEISGFDVELERLAMSMEGPSMNMEDQMLHNDDHNDNIYKDLISEEKPFDEGFWGGIEDEIGTFGVGGHDLDEEVDVFADQLGFLGSSPR
ncbi:UNVERIFIED_CONTAM: Heat stress transcription factor A-6b [Sesamum latifolium]|uniref:Heat stress transcription factor A-6b n=1 Tax=Sesamum latifolium TaxID=2727402 RepID=A0AAW2XVL1_9LAMI